MSMQFQWRFAINTFNTNTQGSSVKMLSIGADTYAKLKAEEADPAIAAILLIYEPVFFAFRDIDQQYGVKSGNYAGNTLGFELYFDQMPLKLRQWESMVRFVYIEDSPEERAIFPNKRAPFESGTYEKRLDALGSLKLKTDADVALAAVNAQVTSFYNTTLGARLVQQTSEGSLGQLSDLRENQRLILADELMGVLGQLMFIHRHNLIEIERYFDLSLLRDSTNAPEIREGTVPSPGINTIDTSGLSISGTSAFELQNLGTGSIRFYFANAANNAPVSSTVFVDVAAGVALDKTAAELGFDSSNTFLCVQNASMVAGAYKVTIVV